MLGHPLGSAESPGKRHPARSSARGRVLLLGLGEELTDTALFTELLTAAPTVRKRGDSPSTTASSKNVANAEQDPDITCSFFSSHRIPLPLHHAHPPTSTATAPGKAGLRVEADLRHWAEERPGQLRANIPAQGYANT